MLLSSINLPFLLHVIIEAPAFATFLLFPSGQLGTPTPHAHAVVRQYALLLLSSILISLTFLTRPLDTTSGKVAGALALYHIGPSLRSCGRIQRQLKLGQRVIWSQAGLYLVVHSICFATLLQSSWTHYLRAIAID